MAPAAKDAIKPMPKAVGVTAKNSIGRTSPVITKKTIVKTTEKKSMKMNHPATTRQRTATVPKVSTPKPKENKPVKPPNSVTKSGKKPWQRKPKPAHSGVPVPEKMRKLLEKQFLEDFDSSF